MGKRVHPGPERKEHMTYGCFLGRLLLGRESLGWRDALFLTAYLFFLMVYSEEIHKLHTDFREKRI